MKFNEFKERIEAEYKARFKDSICVCKIFTCLGKSIGIDACLAGDRSEVANGIYENDAMRSKFFIHLPDGWQDEDDLPEKMVMECLCKDLRIKPPKGSYLYCDIRKISYRKTPGDADKIIKSFGKYVDRLKAAVVEEYEADNLMDRDMYLVREKRYAA